MLCITPQNSSTPERLASNPFYGQSFYSAGQYEVAIDRLESGLKSIEFLSEQLEDFCKIQNRQAEKIRTWSTNTNKGIRQLSEFGTTKKSLLTMSEAMNLSAKENEDFAKSLREKVISIMTNFKTKTFGKSSRCSDKMKSFRKEFEKVQKPWISLIKKLEETREQLKTANKKLLIIKEAEDRFTNDVGFDAKELDEIKTKRKKREEKVSTLEKSEREILNQIEKKKDEYKREMDKILDQILDLERERLKNFNETFQALSEAMNTKLYSNFEQISKKIDEGIQFQQIEQDLDKWNKDFGCNTPFLWPNSTFNSS